LPPHMPLSPSRFSTASWAPVEAPAGPAARRRHLAGKLVIERVEAGLEPPAALPRKPKRHDAYSAARLSARKPPDWRFHNCA